MGLYDSLLQATGQGYGTANQNAMQIAQMPTFADKFLAGLRTGQQAGMAQQMQLANMQHLSAQNQNYKDQRLNQAIAETAKYITPEGVEAGVQRLVGLNMPEEIARGVVGKGEGSEYQKRQVQTKIAADKNQLSADLNTAKKALIEAQTNKNTAAIPLIQAQIDNLQSKSDFLDSKNEVLFGGDNPMYGALIQSQIYRNNNPVGTNPSAAPVINATTKLNEMARKNATSDLNKGWMFATPQQRTKLLTDNGADPGEAKILATQPMAPLSHPAIQNVLNKGIEQHRQILQTSPTADTTPTETE